MSDPLPELVFFDLGDVAARFVPERRLPVLRALAEDSTVDLEEAIWGSGLSGRFDAGEFTADEMAAELAHVMGGAPAREALVAAWCRAFEPDPDVLAVAAALPTRTGLLTNNPPLLEEGLADHLAPIASAFDPLLFSSRLGARKPDARVYARAAEHVGLAPSQLALIDDSARNVDAAHAAGWVAIHFTSCASLRETLHGLGWLPD